jgi:phage baseplate assembly protein V
MIRYGKVSSLNAANATVRVAFEDEDGMVSYELPVLVTNASRNKDYALPDVGDNVVCAFLANGISAGFCLGAVYNQQAKPTENNPDVRSVTFADGTVISYNRASHTLAISASGPINITGNVVVAGDVIVNGISFKTHVHGGITPGGGNTSAPHGG